MISCSEYLDTFETNNEKIAYLNTIIVQYDGRDGCLIQSADYDNKKIYDSTIFKLKIFFPQLYYTDTFMGMLITKKDISAYPLEYWDNDMNIGSILNFIEPYDLKTIKRNFCLTINVIIEHNGLSEIINLTGMILSKKKEHKCVKLVKRIKNAFDNSPHKHIVKNVTYSYKKIYDKLELIQILNELISKQQPLDKDMLFYLHNYIWNYYGDCHKIVNYLYDLSNIAHLKILIILIKISDFMTDINFIDFDKKIIDMLETSRSINMINIEKIFISIINSYESYHFHTEIDKRKIINVIRDIDYYSL